MFVGQPQQITPQQSHHQQQQQNIISAASQAASHDAILSQQLNQLVQVQLANGQILTTTMGQLQGLSAGATTVMQPQIQAMPMQMPAQIATIQLPGGGWGQVMVAPNGGLHQQPQAQMVQQQALAAPTQYVTNAAGQIFAVTPQPAMINYSATAPPTAQMPLPLPPLSQQQYVQVITPQGIQLMPAASFQAAMAPQYQHPQLQQQLAAAMQMEMQQQSQTQPMALTATTQAQQDTASDATRLHVQQIIQQQQQQILQQQLAQQQHKRILAAAPSKASSSNSPSHKNSSKAATNTSTAISCPEQLSITINTTARNSSPIVTSHPTLEQIPHQEDDNEDDHLTNDGSNVLSESTQESCTSCTSTPPSPNPPGHTTAQQASAVTSTTPSKPKLPFSIQCYAESPHTTSPNDTQVIKILTEPQQPLTVCMPPASPGVMMEPESTTQATSSISYLASKGSLTCKCKHI